MKVTKSTENIGTYGGLNFISEKLNDLEFNYLIESYLEKRPVQSTYSYTDVMKNLWLLFLSGGDCAEDIEEHFRVIFSSNSKFKSMFT